MILDVIQLDGAVQPLEIADDCDDPKAVHLIEAAANAILAEWTARRQHPRVDGVEKPGIGVWARPVCYRLITHCIATGTLEPLLARIVRYRRQAEGESLFAQAIVALFATAASVDFTKEHKKDLTRELWYAYRHYVPWQFVDAFIRSVHRFDDVEWTEGLDQRYLSWIIERMAFDPQHSERGRYPTEVRSAAEALLSKGLDGVYLGDPIMND